MFGMVKNVLANLISRPSTRLYPFEKRPFFKGTRGSIDIEIEKCVFCGICQRRCPSNAIVVDRTNKTWTLDPYKCIICNVCVESCPKKCILSKQDFNHPVNGKQKLGRKQEIKQEENQEKPILASK